MKRKLCAALIASILLAIGNASEAFTQEPQPPIVGGYQEASAADRKVVSAARFAVSSVRRRRGGRVSLISVERAETQVVAGINYRLCLRVKIKDKTQNVTTVVYRNLRQKYSLSSWEQDGCRSASSR